MRAGEPLTGDDAGAGAQRLLAQCGDQVTAHQRDVFREHLEYLQDQGHQLSGDPALIAAAMGGMLSMLAYARPAYSDPAILDAIEQACDSEQIPSQRMVSRAYHDSSFMARLCPVAMIFIPCRKGVSHRPDEYAKPEDIAVGTRILARTLAMLSSA